MLTAVFCCAINHVRLVPRGTVNFVFLGKQNSLRPHRDQSLQVLTTTKYFHQSATHAREKNVFQNADETISTDELGEVSR